MVTEMLAWGGFGAHPVQPRELAARRPLAERRAVILREFLARVEATAPEHAAPHRAALARAEAEVAWLDTRAAEEARRAEWSRANPPGGLRDIRETIAIFLGQ